MAYGKEDFVFSGFDDYDFSDFSDFSDEDIQDKSDISAGESDIDEEIRQYCVCHGPLTKDMIGCDSENCAVEWWHYECVGMTEETIPDGDWYCPNCFSAEPETGFLGPSTSTAPVCGQTNDPTESDLHESTLQSTDRDPSPQTTTACQLKENASTSQSSGSKSRGTKGKNKAGDKTKAPGKTAETEPTTASGKKGKQREKAPERPKARFSKNDALGIATSFFITSLKAMSDHPILNCGSEASLGIIGLITTLLLNTNEASFVEFCQSSVLALWLVLTSSEGKCLKPEVYEGMWRNFHVYRISSCATWEKLLNSLNISYKSEHSMKLAYQYLIQSVFGLLMKKRNDTDLPEKESSSEQQIEKEEEKVLRYVAGYIPFALLKKYKKHINNTAKMYCKFLECWSVQSITSGRTFLTYTKEWIDAQDRGRLFRVSDEVYLFFRSMESVARVFLTTSNLQRMSELNINKVLMDNISTTYRVQTYWCALTDSKMSGESSKVFLEIIIKFYIKLRCKSFLKVYLDIRKSTSKQMSKKGEKALRKDL